MRNIWPRQLTPKRQMILSLTAIFLLFPALGVQNVIHVAAAVIVASLADVLINVGKKKPLRIPESAIITGLLCALVIDSTSTILAACAAVVAICSKHLLRIKIMNKQLFNPAAFGITAITVLGGSQSWWGAAYWPATAILGLLIAFRMRRLPMIAAFWLVTLAFLFVGNPALLRPELAASWFNPALLLVSLFMLTEPYTCAKTREGSIMYGILFALFIPFFGLFAGAASVTLALLLTNLFSMPLDMLAMLLKMRKMALSMMKAVSRQKG